MAALTSRISGCFRLVSLAKDYAIVDYQVVPGNMGFRLTCNSVTKNAKELISLVLAQPIPIVKRYWFESFTESWGRECRCEGAALLERVSIVTEKRINRSRG